MTKQHNCSWGIYSYPQENNHHTTRKEYAICQEKVENLEIFGIFSGHGGLGGCRAARLASKLLKNSILKNLKDKTLNREESFKQSFKDFDSYLETLPTYDETSTFRWLIGARDTADFDISGTSAILAVMEEEKIYIVHLGETQAISSIENKLNIIPHQVTNPIEAKRIFWSGGFINRLRVNGELSSTRAFGDFHYKSGITSEQLISVVPDVYVLNREELVEEFLILGSSPILFDHVSKTVMIEICHEFKEEEKEQQGKKENSLKPIAQKIVEKAIENGCNEPVTCLVIQIHQ